jgi:hypothetical protein
MPTRPTLVAAALGLLLAGCGPAKLNENKSYTLTPGDAQSLDLPAISQAQKITVEFTSSAVNVNVHIIKDFKDRDGLDAPPSKNQTLAEKQGKEGSFAVDVPANTATRVIVRGANAKTEVTLQLTNSK